MDRLFADRTSVLLVLPQWLLDTVRVLAGKATVILKLPVSLQIVLRALIDEGLKRDDRAGLLENVAGQAKAVRHIRSLARRGGRSDGTHSSGVRRWTGGRERSRR